MKHIYFCLYILAFFILSSCVQEPDLYEARGSFVAGYSVGNLDAEFVNREETNTDYPEKLSNYKIIVHTKPGAHIAWHNSQGQDSILFRNISVKNSDTRYPLKYTYRFPNICFFQNFTSIELASDHDYDEMHKAGESLLDIVYYLASSCLNFIESDYKKEEPYQRVLVEGDSLTTRDMTLLRWGVNSWLFELNFPTPPTLSKVHNFTITLVADDGTKYVLPVAATFDEEQ
ncbi:MAG: hypothetical protein IJT26_05080 [Bacteroidales bacterium]|nr:hypothetical protein [Bacteroidales bacterium]